MALRRATRLLRPVTLAATLQTLEAMFAPSAITARLA
jgi:hypothetical protein